LRVSDVPILRATARIEGAFSFAPAAQDGAACITVRFHRPGRADIASQYGVVFIHALLDGLMERGDAEAAYAASRVAVRALELKHAARRDAEARRALSCEPQPGSSPVGGYAGEASPAAPPIPSVEGAGHSPSMEPAQPGNTPVGVAAPAGDPLGACPVRVKEVLPDLPPAGEPSREVGP